MLPSARPRDLEEWGRRAAVRQQARLPLGFQSKSLAELEDIFTETAEAQELASSIGDAAEARQWLRTKLQAVGEKAGFPGVLGEALGRAGRARLAHGQVSIPAGRWVCSIQSFGDPRLSLPGVRAGRPWQERKRVLPGGGRLRFPTRDHAEGCSPFGGHASPPRSLENILSAAPPLPGEGTRSSVTHA